MSVKNYYCNMTEYPKIFKNVYWGNFDNETDKLEQNIIENRNNFVKEFEIVRVKNIPQKYHKYYNFEKRYNENKDFFDHVEEYKTKNNDYLVICSPYYNQDELAKKLGYRKYKPLYSLGAFTYIKN
jgi:hypothetical protein